MLHERHPDLFWKAVAYEEQHKDGRKYTWSDRETLRELLARKDEIIASHDQALAKQQQRSPEQPLAEALAAVLDEEDDTLPCLACHL
jgi:hypothetical protein